MSFQLISARAAPATKKILTGCSGINHLQVRHLTPFGHVSTQAFGFAGMKKHPAVIPLVAIMGVAVAGVVSFIVYASNTRENVVFNKSRKTHIESMDLMNPSPLKLRIINQQYNALPEVAALYKDMYGDEKESK